LAEKTFFPRFSRTIFLLVLAVFTASASGFAESLAHADHNAWSKCRHTQQRIERGKPCPCACNKKAKPALRITNEHADCDSDYVHAHAPQFLQLCATLLQLWISIARVRQSDCLYRLPVVSWNLPYKPIRPG